MLKHQTCQMVLEQTNQTLMYTQDDSILISSSEYNIISFWYIEDNVIEYRKQIQEIQIDFNTLFINFSPNGFDIALELQGDFIQILTNDTSKFYSQNQNQKYIGSYKSYPQLQLFQP
ncbi:unnamed protein product [Paramecium pentaurelia]|uniref:Uncharacterized protein n=1 Tax=Paramecium pentaurelia TaxID=43138 RepID=A0A8S1YJI3_9CILI|nr:unnamed protein product [Paramecium pentaurelia]